MNDGLLYIYDGPPVISGDPQCPRCGGTEFRWVGKCVKCADEKTPEYQLSVLKEYLKGQITSSLKQDFELGSNEYKAVILQKVLDVIKDLEEK